MDKILHSSIFFHFFHVEHCKQHVFCHFLIPFFITSFTKQKAYVLFWSKLILNHALMSNFIQDKRSFIINSTQPTSLLIRMMFLMFFESEKNFLLWIESKSNYIVKKGDLKKKFFYRTFSLVFFHYRNHKLLLLHKKTWNKVNNAFLENWDD